MRNSSNVGQAVTETPSTTTPAELFAHYEQLVWRRAHAEAEHYGGLDVHEIVGRTWLLVVQFHHRYDSARGRPATWLRRVVRSAAHLAAGQEQRWRRLGRMPQKANGETIDQPGPGPDAADDAESADLAGAVAAAVDRLPPRQSSVIRDIYWRGMSREAVSRAGFGASGEAVGAMERRALATLRRELGVA